MGIGFWTIVLQMASVESEIYARYLRRERECCKSAGGSGGRLDAVPPADTTYVLQKDTNTHRHTDRHRDTATVAYLCL